MTISPGSATHSLTRWLGDDPGARDRGTERSMRRSHGPAHWYNNEHRYRGIKYVTLAQRHARQDRPLLTARHELYQHVRQSNPLRWSRQTRDWTPIAAFALNPELDATSQTASRQSQLSGSVRTPAFPSRSDTAPAMARNEGDGRRGATRSHAHPSVRASMASTGPSLK